MKYCLQIVLGLGRYLLLLLLVVMLTACDDDDDSKRGELFNNISNLMEEVVQESGIPGVAVYVKSTAYGDFSLATGLADLETEVPVATTQLFRIGSLTKSFTGAAVLELVEAELIDLDAPISDYLGLVNDFEPLADITVRQIMNMTSGLAEYLSVDFILNNIMDEPLFSYWPAELLAVAFTAEPELLFEPGTDFLYSNTNYILLGMLIEKVSGRNYTDYITESFIKPLGLTSTYAQPNAAQPKGLARGYYDSDGDGVYNDWTDVDMSYVWAAGCIISDARDITVWMDAVAKGELVDAALYPDLYQGQEIAPGGGVYGAGILVDDGFGVGHNGTVLGYHADAWHDPETGTTVTVLSNTNNPLLNEDMDPTRVIAEGTLALFK